MINDSWLMVLNDFYGHSMFDPFLLDRALRAAPCPASRSAFPRTKCGWGGPGPGKNTESWRWFFNKSHSRKKHMFLRKKINIMYIYIYMICFSNIPYLKFTKVSNNMTSKSMVFEPGQITVSKGRTSKRCDTLKWY